MNSKLESYGNEKEKEKQKSMDQKKTRDGPIELVIRRVVAQGLIRENTARKRGRDNGLAYLFSNELIQTVVSL